MNMTEQECEAFIRQETDAQIHGFLKAIKERPEAFKARQSDMVTVSYRKPVTIVMSMTTGEITVEPTN